MAEPPDGKEDPILRASREGLRTTIELESAVRTMMLDDLRFCTLDQWPAAIRAERENDPNGARPCLTIDKINQYIVQVVNDFRQNRPAVKVRPVDGGSDVETAKVFQGLVRHIEDQSSADIAYETALESAVRIGLGFFRVLTDYSGDSGFEQTIKIARVPNTMGCYLGPHLMPDGSDAKEGWIFEEIPLGEFKRRWPEALATTSDFDQLPAGAKTFWYSDKEYVTVCEYFYVEESEREFVALEDGSRGYADEMGDEPASPVANSRMESQRRVKWCIHSGVEILEKRDWAGKYIPIVEVIGREAFVDGKRVLWGLTRPSKDSLRMYNYWAALALDTPLPTPSGWTTMREAKAGDVVFDEHGKPCKITGTSPVYINHDCYRITFEDGDSIVADATHRWQVEERGKRKSKTYDWQTQILQTRQLDPAKHLVRTCGPLDTERADLTVHPYVLGVWLGDGHSAEGRITEHRDDSRALAQRIESFGYKCLEPHVVENACTFTVAGLGAQLRSIGLRKNKHIPANYLRASREQRMLLLRGLMDSDGTVNKVTRQCSFTTTLPRLSVQFRELAASLGIKTYILERQREALVANGSVYNRALAYQISFSCAQGDDVFMMPRKRAILNDGRPKHTRRTKLRRIVDVERVKSVPVKCIAVDSPTHLYLAGSQMVPTHNSTMTEKMALAPKAPFIGAVGQFATANEKWKQANRVNFSHLEYDAIEVNGNVVAAPKRQEPTQMEAAIVGALQIIEHDVQTSLGMFKASVGESESQQSGRAILALQRESDTSTFHFHDNASKSIRHLGRILVDLIPKVMDTRRVVRVIGEDDEPNTVTINPEQEVARADIQTAEGIKSIYNLGVGTYDVSVGTGPSYNTKRMEAAAVFSELAKGAADPASAATMRYLTVKNSDFTNSDEATTALKALLPPPVLQALSSDGPIPPKAQAQIAQMQQQGQMMAEKLREVTEENQKLQSGAQAKMAQVQVAAQAGQQELAVQSQLDAQKLAFEQKMAEQKMALEVWKAEQEAALARMKCEHEAALANQKAESEHQHRTQEQAFKLKEKADADSGSAMPQFVEALTQISTAFAQALAQISTQNQQGMMAIAQALKEPKQVAIGGLQRGPDGNITGANMRVN